jgi:hypothetical protein
MQFRYRPAVVMILLFGTGTKTGYWSLCGTCLPEMRPWPCSCDLGRCLVSGRGMADGHCALPWIDARGFCSRFLCFEHAAALCCFFIQNTEITTTGILLNTDPGAFDKSPSHSSKRGKNLTTTLIRGSPSSPATSLHHQRRAPRLEDLDDFSPCSHLL